MNKWGFLLGSKSKLKKWKSDFLRQLKLPTAVKKGEACLAFARTDRLENWDSPAEILASDFIIPILS